MEHLMFARFFRCCACFRFTSASFFLLYMFLALFMVNRRLFYFLPPYSGGGCVWNPENISSHLNVYNRKAYTESLSSIISNGLVRT